MTTGEKIRSRRKELGMSGRELAIKLGVYPSTLKRWEEDDIKSLKVDMYNKLGEILKMNPIMLIADMDQNGFTPNDDFDASREINAFKSKFPEGLSEIEIRIVEEIKKLSFDEKVELYTKLKYKEGNK